MRVGASVVLAFCLSLLVACGVEQSETSSPAVDESAPPSAQAVAQGQASEAAGKQAGELTAQACTTDCQCSLGTHCVGGTCVGAIIAGPPPPQPVCFSDCQCGPSSRCNNPPGDWGQCASCSISWSAATVPPGGTVNLILSSTAVPADGYTRLYGQKNGMPDPSAGGAQFNVVSGSFPITNGPGMNGYYSRWVQMFNASGRMLCQSAISYVNFQ